MAKFVSALTSFPSSLGDGVASITDGVGKVATVTKTSIGNGALIVGHGVGKVTSTISTSVGQIATATTSTITGAAASTASAIGSSVGSVGDGVGNVTSSISEATTTARSALSDGVGNIAVAASSSVEIVATTASSIGTDVAATASNIGSGVAATASSIGTDVATTASNIGSGVASTASSIGTGVATTASNIGTGVGNVATAAVTLPVQITKEFISRTSAAPPTSQPYVRLTNKTNEQLTAEIEKLKTDLAELKSKGDKLLLEQRDELSGANKTLQLRKYEWNSMCRDVIAERPLKPRASVENSNGLATPIDYGQTIRDIFAGKNSDDPLDKTDYLTWLCRDETRTLRCLHYSDICKSQCEKVMLQWNEMELTMKRQIVELMKHKSSVASDQSSKIWIQQQRNETIMEMYDYYTMVQLEMIQTLKQSIPAEIENGSSNNATDSLLQSPGSNKSRSSVGSHMVSPTGSDTRARVAENRRKREEMLRQETEKRRAKACASCENSDENSSQTLRRRSFRRRLSSRGLKDDDGGLDLSTHSLGALRPTRRTMTRRRSGGTIRDGEAEDNNANSSSPALGRRRLVRDRLSSPSNSRSPFTLRRREQLQELESKRNSLKRHGSTGNLRRMTRSRSSSRSAPKRRVSAEQLQLMRGSTSERDSPTKGRRRSLRRAGSSGNLPRSRSADNLRPSMRRAASARIGRNGDNTGEQSEAISISVTRPLNSDDVNSPQERRRTLGRAGSTGNLRAAIRRGSSNRIRGGIGDSAKSPEERRRTLGRAGSTGNLRAAIRSGSSTRIRGDSGGSKENLTNGNGIRSPEERRRIIRRNGSTGNLRSSLNRASSVRGVRRTNSGDLLRPSSSNSKTESPTKADNLSAIMADFELN